MEDQALFACETGAAAGLGSRDLTNPQRRCNLPGFRGLEEVLEVAVFAEDIGESLLDNIVSTSPNEGGILIDLGSGRVREPNGCANLTGLDDSSSGMVVLL